MSHHSRWRLFGGRRDGLFIVRVFITGLGLAVGVEVTVLEQPGRGRGPVVLTVVLFLVFVFLLREVKRVLGLGGWARRTRVALKLSKVTLFTWMTKVSGVKAKNLIWFQSNIGYLLFLFLHHAICSCDQPIGWLTHCWLTHCLSAIVLRGNYWLLLHIMSGVCRSCTEGMAIRGGRLEIKHNSERSSVEQEAMLHTCCVKAAASEQRVTSSWPIIYSPLLLEKHSPDFKENLIFLFIKGYIWQF